jgi:hypothetical protein
MKKVDATRSKSFDVQVKEGYGTQGAIIKLDLIAIDTVNTMADLLKLRSEDLGESQNDLRDLIDRTVNFMKSMTVNIPSRNGVLDEMFPSTSALKNETEQNQLESQSFE